MLFSKILTYSLNAYDDAQIAEEIISYIKTKGRFATNSTIWQKRAKHLIATAKNNKTIKDQSYIIGLAYTEYYQNGFMDILYPKLLWQLIVTKQKNYYRKIYKESILRYRGKLQTSYQFEEKTHQFGFTFYYWPLFITNPWRWVKQFARDRCYYFGTLDKHMLIRASLEVQRQNIQNNYDVASRLRSNKHSRDPKVQEIRFVAKQFADSMEFISEAAATQEAAAKWDRLFIKLIKQEIISFHKFENKTKSGSK